MERYCWRNRMIIADCTAADQDFLHHFVPIDRQFDRHPEVIIIERGHIHPHRESVMQKACGFHNPQAWHPLQQMGCFRVNPVNHIHITIHHRVLAGDCVNQGQGFH